MDAVQATDSKAAYYKAKTDRIKAQNKFADARANAEFYDKTNDGLTQTEIAKLEQNISGYKHQEYVQECAFDNDNAAKFDEALRKMRGSTLIA